jgi:hypothetical protein
VTGNTWGHADFSLAQVQRLYNGLGQLTQEYQAVGGTVNTSTTPYVGYAYSEMAGGANHSRLTRVDYPTATGASGKQVTYDYGTAGGLNDRGSVKGVGSPFKRTPDPFSSLRSNHGRALRTTDCCRLTPIMAQRNY